MVACLGLSLGLHLCQHVRPAMIDSIGQLQEKFLGLANQRWDMDWHGQRERCQPSHAGGRTDDLVVGNFDVGCLLPYAHTLSSPREELWIVDVLINCQVPRSRDEDNRMRRYRGERRNGGTLMEKIDLAMPTRDPLLVNSNFAIVNLVRRLPLLTVLLGYHSRLRTPSGVSI
ncbi:hypothetical protein V8F20_005057 [Naviculisporaceae sp. PSN 640]